MLVNLMPHHITVQRDGDQLSIEIPPSGTVARVTTEEMMDGRIEDISVVRRSLGAVEGLPAPQDGHVYIVSSMVLSAINDRNDVVAPDTGSTAIRSRSGRLVAVRRFVRA